MIQTKRQGMQNSRQRDEKGKITHKRERRNLPRLVSQAHPPNSGMLRLAVLRGLDSEYETEKDEGPEEHHAAKEGDVGIKVPEDFDDGGHFFPPLANSGCDGGWQGSDDAGRDRSGGGLGKD